MHRRRHPPFAFAQNRLDLRQEMGVAGHIVEMPLLLQRRQQPVKIAGRLVHVGLFDLDIAQCQRRVTFKDLCITVLADDLPVDRRIGGNVNDKIAFNRGRAGQPTPGRKTAHLVVARFLGANVGDVGLCRRDAMLGELAELRLDLAAPAGRTPAADALHIDAQLTRRLDDRRAALKPATLARWGEYDEVIGHAVTGFPSPPRAAPFTAATRTGRCRIGIAIEHDPGRAAIIMVEKEIGCANRFHFLARARFG